MIVCQCVGVSDTTITRLIESGVGTVAEISRRTGAGQCCASCRDQIRSLLYSSTAAAHTASSAQIPRASAA